VAACLAFLFSFSSLAPLAASSFDNRADMSCCKTKAKCCCRRHSHTNPSNDPAIGAAGCVDCGNATLGSVSPIGPAVIRLTVLTPAIHPAGAVAVATTLPHSRISTHKLQQRPPPHSVLA